MVDLGTRMRRCRGARYGRLSLCLDKVTQIEASRFDANVAYRRDGFRLDDLKPYVYLTRDGGRVWPSITSGRPHDGAVDAVREDPVRRGLLLRPPQGCLEFFRGCEHWQSPGISSCRTLRWRDLVTTIRMLIFATHGRSFVGARG